MKLITTFRDNNSYSDKDILSGKCKWSVSRGITVDVNKYSIIENSQYDLQVNHKGTNVIVPIKNLTVLEAYHGEELAGVFAVSTALLSGMYFSERRKQNTVHFRFYFKKRMDFQKIDDCLFIADEDVPDIFIKNTLLMA